MSWCILITWWINSSFASQVLLVEHKCQRKCRKQISINNNLTCGVSIRSSPWCIYSGYSGWSAGKLLTENEMDLWGGLRTSLKKQQASRKVEPQKKNVSVLLCIAFSVDDKLLVCWWLHWVRWWWEDVCTWRMLERWVVITKSPNLGCKLQPPVMLA